MLEHPQNTGCVHRAFQCLFPARQMSSIKGIPRLHSGPLLVYFGDQELEVLFVVKDCRIGGKFK